jgi:predicted O-methyltransferase YrrM
MWTEIGPDARPIGDVIAPMAFHYRRAVFEQFLGSIDDTSSDCRTIDLLCTLLVSLNPAVIAEVGTYRGFGTLAMAETVRQFKLNSHIWTCDPTDYETEELYAKAGLQTYVTYVPGTFEDLLQKASPLDFCYVDASSADEGSLRLRYCLTALECLRPGGVVVVDDAKGDWPGAASVRRLGQRNGLYLPQQRGVVILQA